MGNDDFTDFDSFMLKQLFETGSLAPQEDSVEQAEKAKPRFREQIAAFFGRKLADA